MDKRGKRRIKNYIGQIRAWLWLCQKVKWNVNSPWSPYNERQEQWRIRRKKENFSREKNMMVAEIWTQMNRGGRNLTLTGNTGAHNGMKMYPLSLACTSAPWCNRYSTTDTRLYPAAKCSGVEWRPSKSLQFTFWGLQSCWKTKEETNIYYRTKNETKPKAKNKNTHQTKQNKTKPHTKKQNN